MGKMQLPEEFKEFIYLLNNNNVKYLMLGGWAVGYYSNPRATKDIDFLVFNDEENLKKIKKVFLEFKSPPVDVEILKEKNGFLYIGRPPLRIEIISNADGIKIEKCYDKKNIVEIDGVKIKVISKDDLIKNKKSTNRMKDHSDVEVLEKYKINPLINTKDILKLKIIMNNIESLYGSEIVEEKNDIKKRKNENSYDEDFNIIKETILLYNKALNNKNKEDVFEFHNSFRRNPLTRISYCNFKYKIKRKKIYDEIEYKYKMLLKNEYSYLEKNDKNKSRKKRKK
jgi:hypothetical protein